MPPRFCLPAVATAALLFSTPAALGQVTLPNSGIYSQDFNTIGTGLPPGWTVRDGATSTSLGSDVSLTNYAPLATPWGSSLAQFANYASALNPGLSGSENSLTQAGLSNRALGIRQGSTFGDPGAAFTLQLASTTGYRNFSLSFSAQLLSVQGRDTTFTVRYAIGAAPSSFTNLGTINTGTLNGNTFGEDTFVADSVALNGINDNAGPVWIQVAALSASTGTGTNRDTFAIDNFQLTYTPVPEPTGVLVVGGVGVVLARSAFRRRSRSA